MAAADKTKKPKAGQKATNIFIWKQYQEKLTAQHSGNGPGSKDM